MFDLFSWSHILILLVVALVVVGPKDLPRMMNMAGRWAGKARAMANDFKKSFDEMARQEELEQLRQEIEQLKRDQAADLYPPAVEEPAAEAPAAQAAAPEAEPDIGPEPRSGEFQITGGEKPAAAPAPQ